MAIELPFTFLVLENTGQYTHWKYRNYTNWTQLRKKANNAKYSISKLPRIQSPFTTLSTRVLAN